MQTNVFQIILYAVFGLFVVVGFGGLALYGFLQKDPEQEAVKPDIQVWGLLSEERMQPILRQLNRNPNRSYNSMTYVHKNPATVRDEYIEAIAVSEHPDLLLLDHRTILELEETLQTVPYGYLPLARYQQQFTLNADIFIRPDGYIAIPFLSDAMVLYYNEALRLQSRIRALPSLWEHFGHESFRSSIKRYRETNRALVPLGAYRNYDNATDVFIALMLQTAAAGSLTVDAAADILRFYAGFANTRSPVFTWSVALDDARDMFVSGRLLFYPGYISEFSGLKRAGGDTIPIRALPLPQISRESAPVSPAVLYGFTIPKRSRVPTPALNAAIDFVGVLYGEDNNLPVLFDNIPPAIQNYYPAADAGTTETAFIDSLFSAKSIYLTAAERQTLLVVLRGVVVGTMSAKDGAQRVITLFQ